MMKFAKLNEYFSVSQEISRTLLEFQAAKHRIECNYRALLGKLLYRDHKTIICFVDSLCQTTLEDLNIAKERFDELAVENSSKLVLT